MKISLNWLTEYIDLSSYESTEAAALELGSMLTMKTCEIEEVVPFMPWLKDFSVARVDALEAHPDADKLKVCQVNTGKEVIQIVTGAGNVRQGGVYPVAPVGSTLPSGMQMKKAKLRGLESSGMLCSSSELGIEDFMLNYPAVSEDGLLTLPDDWQPGKSLADIFFANDFILDVDNKSITNRPDLWSHFGFARELSALLDIPLKKNPYELHNLKFKKSQTVAIEDDSARGYAFAVLDNLQVQVSPLWLQARLIACGIRPINSIVDISNFVMLDLGQPNHTFDKNQIKKNIHVGFSKVNEKLITLDEKERTLPAGLPVIRDGEHAVAIGGVMGGASTEVTAETSSIFLESASFHRTHIRKTVSALSLRSEASARFEKGQDTSLILPAIERFLQLLKEQTSGVKCSEVEINLPDPVTVNTIETSLDYIRNRLGKDDLPDEEIKAILERLGMHTSQTNDNLQIQVPTWRSVFDISIAEDIVEEIGRVIGYGTITARPLLVANDMPRFQNRERELEHFLRDVLVQSYHFQEVYNYSFTSEENLQVDARHSSGEIRLENAIASDLPVMRRSLLPGLLQNIRENYREYDDIRFFELGRIYLPSDSKDKLPNEPVMLAGIFTSSQDESTALNNLKNMLAGILLRLGLKLPAVKISKDQSEILHPGRRAAIGIDEQKEKIIFGQVHPSLSEDLGCIVYYFEVLLSDLMVLSSLQLPDYHPLFKFPGTEFDLTVTLDKTATFTELMEIIGGIEQEIPVLAKEKRDKTFIQNIFYLGSYEGEQIESGKKAVSLRIFLRNAARTLESDEIKKMQEKVIEKIKKAGFSLR
ncbi:MAG: phenylalanine--tRNA ligase subunit beta [Leptospiraceae bacterium]|nr:phenylalanine--tRNA ligase subunit beta [Leptospiraceae bacterium]